MPMEHNLDAWLDRVTQRALCFRHTLRATYDICRMAIDNNVPGDFVECGVFAGSNSAAMARALKDSILSPGHIGRPGTELRRVHLFDSFSGIPLAGPHDTEFLEAGHKAGLSACSLEAVKSHMSEWGIPPELLIYHEGLFEDTLCMESPLEIAVLRLDGDLYESTRVCLEQLFPLVSKGGWIIIDDFDLSGSRKAALEVIGHGFGPVYCQKQS